MKVNIPKSWQEMTDYQQTEIIHILHQINPGKEDFKETFIKIIKVLLMKNDSPTEYLKMRKILKEIPISAFREAVEFIWQKPNLYTFPKIKGLVEPAPRMGDLIIKQFSICDTLHHRYTEKKEEIYLRQLVAALYRLEPKSPHDEARFDEQKLREIALITDKISLKEAQRIGFVFMAIKRYIVEAYPLIFPKKKEEDLNTPNFQNKPKFTPFSQIITLMAADELRLLGTLHECQNTRLYDFMNAFLESHKIHKLKAKALKS